MTLPTGSVGVQARALAIRQALDHPRPWLHFPASLETAFRHWYVNGIRGARILLAIVVIALLVINSLSEWLIMRPDARFLPGAHFIQWGIEFPVIVLALVIHLSHRLRWLWDPALILAGFVIALGVEAQRVLGLTEGFELPALFALVAIVSGAISARLRFWQALPAGVVFILAWSAIEIIHIGSIPQAANELFVGFVALSGTLVGLYGQEYQARRAWLQQEWNRLMAETDAMTLMPNRRVLTRLGSTLRARARSDPQAIALAVIDIDHFKRYNDQLGHDAGDDCIRRVGRALATQAHRELDLVCRLGGEEFVVVWHGRPADTLFTDAERCRQTVRDLAIPHPDGGDRLVTVSVGAVCIPASAEPDLDALYRCADAELYIAKRAGRDRCSVRHLQVSGPETIQAPAAVP